MDPKNSHLTAWVEEMRALCRPDAVRWCDGSEAERAELEELAVRSGEMERLDPAKHPGSFYARSAENDVARVENLTFICSRRQTDAGPTNNWMAPDEAYRKLGAIFDGSMKGRTMYVVPFLMGIPGSRFNRIGIELTDSIYVVLNMCIMTRIGKAALDELGASPDFTKGLHSKADLDDKKRFICHFPEDNAIWSVGSNYGGNVLLGKKCLALRIASVQARSEGWLAEHMLIAGIEDPQGRVRYVAAAFPSRCGKTNLAMLTPPASMPGWKVWTVGEDIAWLRPGPDGRLYAVNPEAGFFGVAPGTNWKTNPNAMRLVTKNTIFTNVVKTDDGGVWWEGMENPPAGGTDWRGKRWTPASGTPGSHPNARFTAPASQCPTRSSEALNPNGVPISAILFGGRRSDTTPLVRQSLDWTHGVYMAATMTSETTAAAQGPTGVLRRDPMAMLPFIGYNAGDYLAHWLSMEKRLSRAPKIFYVNWFLKGEDGRFVWPGYGENLRVLKWIIERAEGEAGATETPIGFMPRPSDLDLTGADISREALEKKLLHFDRETWLAEVASQRQFLESLGPAVPRALFDENQTLHNRLSAR